MPNRKVCNATWFQFFSATAQLRLAMAQRSVPSEHTPLLHETQSQSLNHNERSAVQASPDELYNNDDESDPTKVQLRRKVLIFAAIWTGVFLGALDTTIVATLVSSISADFAASNNASWLMTSYLLATATFTPLYGRLADILGRRWAHVTALSLFTVGTLMCGLSSSMTSLIVARTIAGMGGGGIMTTSSIIASDLIPLKRRGLVQGMTNIFFGFGAGIGGPLGGLLADTIGWRWAFLIQLPVLTLALVLVTSFVRYRLPGQANSKREMVKRIDYGGSLTLIISIGSLLLSLSFKNNEQYPWSAPIVWGNLIVFVVFLGAFLFVEAKLSSEPVLPLRILMMQSPFCIAWFNFIISMASFSMLYMLPLWFETVALQSSSSAGAHLVPNAIALALGSLLAGWYMRQTGKYYNLILVASFLPTLAFAMMTTLRPDSGWFGKWMYIVPGGLGISAELTALLIALIAAVDRSDIAVATGISYLFRYTGQVVGVALSSSVLQAILASELSKRITGPGSTELISQIRHTSTIVKTLPPHLQQAAVESYAIGLRVVFIMNAAVSALGTLCALPIKEYPLAGSFTTEEPERNRRGSETESS